MKYQNSCPQCRAPIPEYFKAQYYHHNVDKDFQKIIKKRFPVEYEEHLQEMMRGRLEKDKRFKFEIEIGHYYNGYENPSNVYDYE